MSFTVRPLKDSIPKRSYVQPLKAALKAIVPIKKKTNPNTLQTIWQRVSKSRLFVIGMAIVVAIAIIAIVIRLLIALQIVSIGQFFGSLSDSLPTDARGHINILLLGQGDQGHDGVDLTDTIMVASIDPKNTNSVVLVSLPRDLIVDATFLGDKNITSGRRLNALYRDIKGKYLYDGETKAAANAKAMRQVQTELSRMTGIDIQYTIKIDFIGFKNIVDELGGITIDVPYTIIDREYPDENYGYQTFNIQKGLQTLDGETALKYARSRHTTSDFSRSARQQQLISALANKAKEDGILLKPNVLFNLLSILNENFATTASTGELVQLASLSKKVDAQNVITMQINDRSGYFSTLPEPGGILYTPPREDFGGASVLLPISVPEFPVTWVKLQSVINLLNTYRAVYLQKPTISVLNAGARSGTARSLAYEFSRYGFEVAEIANADIDKDLPTSVVQVRPKLNPDGSINKDVTSALESFAKKLPFTTGLLPSNLPAIQQSDITIIVGKDYVFQPIDTFLND